MSSKKHTSDISEATCATYLVTGEIVEVVEPILGEYGRRYWLCRQENDELVIAEEDSLSNYFYWTA